MRKVVGALFLALTSAVHYVPSANTVHFQVRQSLMWSGQVSPQCTIKSVKKCYTTEVREEGNTLDKFSDIVFTFHEPECKTVDSRNRGYWFKVPQKTEETCADKFYAKDDYPDAEVISDRRMKELRGKQVVGMRFMRTEGFHTIGRTQYIVAEPEEADCEKKWSDKCAGFARDNNMKYKAINNAQSISQLRVKSKIWGQNWGSIDNFQTDSDTAENLKVEQADNKCRMSRMDVYNHMGHNLICKLKISFDNCAPIETATETCDENPTQILVNGEDEKVQNPLTDDYNFLDMKNTCLDKPNGSRKIQNIYAAHTQNGVEAIVLSKDTNKEGPLMFLGGRKGHGSKQGTTYNNNQFVDWGDDGFRVTGFRYQTGEANDAIKSLQFLGVIWHSQQEACEAQASQATASIWITLIVVIDLLIVVLVLLKFPRPQKDEEGDIIKKLKDHIDQNRKTEMYEAISFTSVINFLFILGVAYFLLDMNDKLVLAQSSGVIMPYVFTLLAFNWLYLFITVLSAVLAAIAYSTELECDTHEFERRQMAWIAFAIDLAIKVVTTVTGGIIYMQFEHESMIPFVLLSVFSLCVLHLNVYDIVKVGQLHRPQTDELLAEAREKYDIAQGKEKSMPERPAGDDSRSMIASVSAQKLIVGKDEGKDVDKDENIDEIEDDAPVPANKI